MARVYYYNTIINRHTRRVVYRTPSAERHQTTRPYPLRIITSHRLVQSQKRTIDFDSLLRGNRICAWYNTKCNCQLNNEWTRRCTCAINNIRQYCAYFMINYIFNSRACNKTHCSFRVDTTVQHDLQSVYMALFYVHILCSAFRMIVYTD